MILVTEKVKIWDTSERLGNEIKSFTFLIGNFPHFMPWFVVAGTAGAAGDPGGGHSELHDRHGDPAERAGARRGLPRV